MNTVVRAAALAAALAPPLLAQTPLPGDPLTTEETRDLVRIATEYARAKGLGGELVLVAADVASDKPAGTHDREITPEQAGRLGEALFFGYEKNEGVRVLVDLARRQGVHIARIPARSVPLGREEVERAARLALADPEVVQLLGPNASRFRVVDPGSDADAVEGLRLVSSEDRCSRNRCAELFFRSGGYYIAGYRVLVDLTARTVRVQKTK